MSAVSATARGWDPDAGPVRRALAGPAEGWSTLVALIVMVTSLAWSIDDARWVRGVGAWTDFLPLAGVAGIAMGFAGPKLGWGRWTTHLIGVAFAALVLPLIAGGIVLGDSVTGFAPVALAARYQAAAEVVTQVWIDLAIKGLPLTSQYGHYFIALGALVWATGQYAAYAVFGHRRPLDVVIVTGLVLLGNMALTRNDQLHLIVLYSLASLALLVRAHAFDERTTWIRRRIGDPAAVSSLYLRGGAVFIGAAILFSLSLTATASSAPLQGLWKGIPGTLLDVSQWLQRYLPGGGASRDPGVVIFGETSPIIGSWSQDSGIAFVAQVPASAPKRFKWRIGTYAKFDLNAWSWGSSTRTLERKAGQELLAGLADDPDALAAGQEVKVTITPETLVSSYVVSPAAIRAVDQPTRLTVTGQGGWFSTVQFDGAPSYTVDALLPVLDQTPGGITANRLRVASRDYGSEVLQLYTKVPDGAIGPAAQSILNEVLARSPADNPYDVALTMQQYLADPANFRYDTDVLDEIQANCEGLSTVECFARIRAGYCQFYASTMAILLRQHGIPTRLVQGFLPGERSSDGREVVRNAGAHAWVEVYFPAYGWIEFDPTGGGVGEQVAIAQGPVESPTPRPTFRIATDNPGGDGGPDAPRRTAAPGGAGAGGFSGGSSSGPFIVIATLLAIGAVALGSIAWRRGPRPIHPDRAWGSISSLAGRFGLGQRASQTVYEYAGTLGEAVPAIRPELSTVANAKVEIAYGHRDLGQDRMRAVAEAHRRLRIGLLRLAFRRPRRRPPRGS
jgi:transglutaminase-like putative cysteine protease